jgi:chemotaxis protein CheD
MGTTILGVGELAATAQPGEELKTLALGSCVALLVLDPVSHCVAMDHVALPDSAVSLEKAAARPGHFADTGVPATLAAMRTAGANGDCRKYLVKLVGGASVADPEGRFQIGKRNVLAIRKALWQLGMGPLAEEVGGHLSRSVAVDVDTGTVRVYANGSSSRF